MSEAPYARDRSCGTSVPEESLVVHLDEPSSGVSFRDLFPSYDADQAEAFLEALFGRTKGYVGLTLISSGGQVTHHMTNGFDRWADGKKTIAAHEAVKRENFWIFSTYTWARWNTYAQVGSTLRKRPTSSSERGKSKDASELPGLFADLDVKAGKKGAFQSRAELDAFLAKLPEPTMLVNTAGADGGTHGYWLYDKPMKVENFEDRRELDGWYDLLAHHAGPDHKIDHVQDYARILRVPGTIRWPKRVTDPGEPQTWMPVQLVKFNGPRYKREELLELTEPYRQVAIGRHDEYRQEFQGVRDSQLGWLESVGLARSAQKIWEERFNSEQDWGPLLKAAGWKLHRDGRDKGDGTTAARYWTRPGKEFGESACTDYKDSKVMYVYTDDPFITPCLVPTPDRFQKIATKYSFALHFLADGDEGRLVRAIFEGKGRVL